MSEEWTTVDTSNPENKENKVEYEIETEEVSTSADENQAQDRKQNADTSNAGQHDVEQASNQEIQQDVEEPQSGAQKRIRQLVRQKKERDEQIQELISRQSELEERLKSQQQEIKTSLEKNFESAEAQINSRIELAEDAYRQALESGDTDRIVIAQKNLNKAQGDATTLQVTRNQYQPVEAEEAQQPQQQQVQQQQQPAQYDKLAVEWAGRNPWFGQDNVMTTLALEIDQELKTEGYDPTDEDFYKEIDTRLRSQYPQRFGGEVQQEREQETSTPAQVVGGASRTSSASSGKKVRLTKEDVRLAEKWGIPLEQYAAEKLKVDKADGEYTSVY
jgi:hypothetical protein|tara:strand:+ start:811 stop:1806 length:996 start_codon:yes stop_codon:yes gene_type:complete